MAAAEHSALPPRAVRQQSREELHRELQELLAASRPSATQSGGLATVGDDDAGTPQRRSSERLSGEQPHVLVRKRSSEHLFFEKRPKPGGGSHNGTAAGGVNGSGAAAAGAGHNTFALQSVPRAPSFHGLELGERSSRGCACPAWLPYRAVGVALKQHPAIWLTSLIVMLALTTAGVVGVMATAASEVSQRRTAAEGFAINAAVAFERQLLSMFSPLLALDTIIQQQPQYAAVNATFDSVAHKLLQQIPVDNAVTTLIAAPQGVLRNFYPLEGYCKGDNCTNINLDLFRRPDRRGLALKTVEGGVLTMQGPLVLSQGYFGLVGRQPVYVTPAAPNETWGAPDGPAFNCTPCYNATTRTRFWGFVNAVINLDSLVSGADSRLTDLKSLGYRYDLHRIDPDTGEKLAIAHSTVLPQAPVTASVHLPQSTWVLGVSPEHGWVPVWRAPILAVVVVVSALMSLLLGAILVSSKLQAWLQAANDALAEEKERMDVLLARQHNLISLVLQQDGDATAQSISLESRTLARIEDMRREIGMGHNLSGVDELQLLELLDEGSYGKVFRGLWRGSEVAVKTMVLPAKMSGVEKRERMLVMEAAISSALSHANIVQTYTYIIKPSGTAMVACATSSDGGSSSRTSEVLNPLDTPEANVHNFEVSLVLEYADWGSLRTALDAGAFFASDNSLNFAAILDTAADIARAMLHLHKNSVLHSDLKVRNVLLKSSNGGRGCIAKVADFGLAVRIDFRDTHVSHFQGTMSHMAPESLLHGHLSKASDVYAFGITLWELFTGGTAYQGIPRALVGHKVAVLGLRPTLPPFTPPEFLQLVQDCWAHEAEKRPSFDEVLERLLAMRTKLGSAPTPPLQRYQLPTKAVKARSSDEQNVAAIQAQGLVQMASYYVNMSGDGSSAITSAVGGGGMGIPGGTNGRQGSRSFAGTPLEPILDGNETADAMDEPNAVTVAKGDNAV